jgi:hypothetical protein
MYSLVFAHFNVACAIIRLHGIFSPRDESEFAVVISAAQSIATITRRVTATNESALDPRKHHMLIGVTSYIVF